MRLDRRDLLRSLAALGSVGSAGCFGGDADAPDTPSPTDGSPAGSPPESPMPTATERPTPTRTTVCGVCVDVPDLIVTDGATPEAAAGSTVSVTAAFRNPYEFEVVDVEVALDPPAADWSVTPDPITFDAVPPGERRDLEWEVTVPEGAAGEHTLTTVTTIQGPRIDHTIRTNHVDMLVTGA